MKKILTLPRPIMLHLILTALVISARPATGQLRTRPFTHNGYSRPYLIYRPARIASHPAVVFMLGGITSDAQSTSKQFGWTALADQYGFLVVFPDPVSTNLTQPASRKKNITFWQMQGSRVHIVAPGAPRVDDEGYLLAVLRDVLHRDHPDRHRIFFAGFSSGSGMAQLFASRHSQLISGVAAVATPLMDPPAKLRRPVPILYIHGDEDEQLEGFETNSPHFATTPHGNWVTWGYLDGCQRQTARKTPWGVQFSWEECRRGVPVVADFVVGVGHEWEGSRWWNQHPKQVPAPLDFTHQAWQFFASLHAR